MSKSTSRRPPRKQPPEEQQRVIRIRCPERLKNKLQVLARLNGIDLSKFLREAAEHYIDHLTDGGGRHVALPDPEDEAGAQN